MLACVKFAIVGAFVPTEELVPLAIAADELGYHSFCVGDHVVDLETISTPYPYEADGSRRWDHEAEWPDPWVLFGAMGSARMGGSPEVSAVNPDGETWEVKDLVVADASCFPTASGVNPMISIEAIAYMNAKRLAARLTA